MRELLRRPLIGASWPAGMPLRHARAGERASDGRAGGGLDGLQVLAAGLRGLLENLVELLFALADELGEVGPELVAVPRHPVRAARLDLLVHAVQGGLQFALERPAELLDQRSEERRVGKEWTSGPP